MSNIGLDDEIINRTIGSSATGIFMGSLRNPLICSICQDYYKDPCLLSCYHTFCANCLCQSYNDNKVSCPICRQTTQFKDGFDQPPSDQIMQQLVEFTNTENPPCANCDKRNKTAMFFCTTCGQALCTHCRENTHKAKMFSSHEVVHMSKCNMDAQKRCLTHTEQYIMYSQSTKSMLCATCYRDIPADARLHCIDIETAWQQASKKIERAANSIYEIQANVRDGIVDLKLQLDDLRQSLEIERKNLNSFCQGIQGLVNKTQSTILIELHREFDVKERLLRTQLVTLGNSIPILQMHLGLCTIFTSSTTRYQFLELVHPMLDRLSRVAQLGQLLRQPLLSTQLKSNFHNEFMQVLNQYIGFQSQPLKNVMYDQMQSHYQLPHESHLNQQPKNATKSQIHGGYESGRFNNHCRTFDNQLQELSNQLKNVKDRLGELHRDIATLQNVNTPPLVTRYESVTSDCNLLDQQLENQKIDLEKLRTVFDALWEEQLCRIHLEKEVFHSQMNDILSLKNEVKQLQSIAHQLEPFAKIFPSGISTDEMKTTTAESFSHQYLQVLLDHLTHIQIQDSPQVHISNKEFRSQRTSSVNDNIKDIKEIPTRCRTPSGNVEAVLDSSGNIVVYGTKHDSKKGISIQSADKPKTKDDRKKSLVLEDSRDYNKVHYCSKSPNHFTSKTLPAYLLNNKLCPSYREFKSVENNTTTDIINLQKQPTNIGEESEYQRISDASSANEMKKQVQAQIHTTPAVTVTNKCAKVVKPYSASDSEDLMYNFDGDKEFLDNCNRRPRRASCDSLSTTGSGSRRSSVIEGLESPSITNANKTLLFVIGASPTPSTVMHKQRSWETFPRVKNKRNSLKNVVNDPNNKKDVFGQLKKADSFEGHEEAVRTLVAAVQETRSQLRQHRLHQRKYHRKSKTN